MCSIMGYCDKDISQEDFEAALAEFDKAITFDQSKSEYFLERGKCYLQLGDNKNAFADFKRAIKLDNRNEEAYFYRGKCFQAFGENKRAQNDFAQAKRFGFVEENLP